MKKIKNYCYLITIVFFIAILIVFSSCSVLRGWEYDIEVGVFKSEDEALVLDFRYLDGEISVNGERILLSIGLDNDLRGIDVNAHMSGPGGVSDEDILVKFRVDTNKKERTLTLTVIGGTMMDSVEPEYILHFYEGEKYKIE